MTEPDLTEDGLLAGRVKLLQPRAGYRVAIDPVLLAAALNARAGERLLDLGCGSGAVGLCAARRLGDIEVTGLERAPRMAALARRNAWLNRLAGRVRTVTGDVRDARRLLAGLVFDHAAINPPYLETERASPSPRPGRAAAMAEPGAMLETWIETGFALVRPGGTLTLIHRADRLDQLLAALSRGGGSIIVHPLWPKPGIAARRVLVRARCGGRGPLRLAAGTVLHRPDGSFSPAAAKLLVGGGLAL